MKSANIRVSVLDYLGNLMEDVSDFYGTHSEGVMLSYKQIMRLTGFHGVRVKILTVLTGLILRDILWFSFFCLTFFCQKIHK